MIGTYGIAKIDVAAITNANVQFVRDTDLGIQTNFQKDISVIPSGGGRMATCRQTLIDGNDTANPALWEFGGGYSLASGNAPMYSNNNPNRYQAGERVICNVVRSNGTGSGGKVVINTIWSMGSLRPYTEASVVSSTAYVIPANRRNFTTTATIGLAANGANGKFYLTSDASGNIIKCVVAQEYDSTVPYGSGYIEGEIVTFSSTTLNAAAAFGAGAVTTGTSFAVRLTRENVTSSLDSVKPNIEVIDGGNGHAIGDILEIQEEGSSIVEGLGKVTVLTLDVGKDIVTAPHPSYPQAIINTSAAAGAIQVKDTKGNIVILGEMLPGVPRKFTFSQVMGAGTGMRVGEVTILY